MVLKKNLLTTSIDPAYLVRERTPVTGELVEWLPLPTEPGSLPSGGLQYVVRFAPLLPPAMADTPTVRWSLLLLLSVCGVISPLYLLRRGKQLRHGGSSSHSQRVAEYLGMTMTLHLE